MSPLEFDESTSRALESLYGMGDMVRRRELVHEALGAAAGERILDVGCGPGFYVAELCERVGPTGHVAGVDLSTAMLALAEKRLAAVGNAELAQAPATALPFADGSFDAVVCVQVLEYVADLAGALAEFHRILRPGGRVVIWDVDWETASMRSGDPARMRRVLDAWDRHLVHRALPQTLAPVLRASGFADVSLTGHAFATTTLAPDTYGGSLVGTIGSYLAGLEDFPRDEATAWADEQAALGEAGAFYFACVQCCFTAARPAY